MSQLIFSEILVWYIFLFILWVLLWVSVYVVINNEIHLKKLQKAMEEIPFFHMKLVGTKSPS